MDDSSSWLGFSLSNHPHLHLSLFEAFSSPSNPASVVDTATKDQRHHVATSATDHLAMLAAANTAGAPKLEDFLGGGGAQFSAGHNQTTQISMSSESKNDDNNSNNMIYDSELKTIAASFLRGYNYTQQIEAQKNDVVSTPAILPAETNSPTAKKAVDSFGQRTSIYRGVTRHRWTGRYEAHLWDNSCRREGQSRKGRQVYLGGYDKEDKAARAYDLAALKYWGPTTTTNFPVCNYEKEIEEMKNMTRQEFVASLRRKSSGFSRGASIYRGVTRHHQHGRWQARIGRVAGNKDLYLGTFSTQEEAAEAYDIAAIKFRGLNAVTNFDMSRYDVKSIATTNLPIGGMSSNSNAKSSKPTSSPDHDTRTMIACCDDSSGSTTVTTTLSFATAGPTIKQDPSSADYWSNVFGFQNATPSDHHLTNHINNVGGFLGYDNNHNSNTIINGNIGTTDYDQLPQVNSSSSSGYIGWNNYNNTNNNIGSSLHSFQHQTHAKHPSTLFQTPIFGME